jgi:anti-sigma-K factor RskA
MSDQMHSPEMLDMVAVYALGALTPDEARAVSEHIALCAECRAEYKALRPAADAVGFSAEERLDDAQSARLKSTLMQRIRPAAASRAAVERDVPRRRAPIWPAYLVAAAAIIIAIINILTTVDLRAELSSSRDRIAQLAQQNESELRAQARDREMIADLVASDSKKFAVPGGEIITRNGRLYMTMDNLQPAPAGRVYQTWTLARGAKTVTPSVTFVPDKSGIAVVALPVSAKNVVAVAVSVEPTGGSPQPTTKPLFIRQLE